MTIQKHKIPEEKIKSLGELAELIKTKKTILITSIKDIPASQFQEIGKKLRGKAIVKVPKKNLIFRAIDSSENEAVKKLKEQIKESTAILFSDLDCFDLALELVKNKSPAKAKTGQLSPKDIKVDAGPTELVPGPAISELGALGIEVQIEKGKIHIRKPKTIVEEGKKISASAAEVMNKLDIKPFTVGFIPLCAFDTQEEKLYLDINIDREKTLEELKSAYAKALPFAIDVSYITNETIIFLLQKAGRHEEVLEKFVEKEKISEAGASKEEIIKKDSQEKDKQNEQDIKENNELTDKKISETTGEADMSEPKTSEEKEKPSDSEDDEQTQSKNIPQQNSEENN